ncbi:putative siderophore transport system ATP-binding protein YusV [Devosia equisanguinis]|uniref:Putative siderophore transport system ATP-binding protein YusV n=1 Tax=Devosia equisanguinis TaxID=2490941 RepID=A0A447I7D9_9HYPH|nr:ABC transporter ATP-binding protein [Devosia equisanguinis]VDS03307.1 putative siderophore transport system ATP-binding protein YusV [Devosia equisanguinis]
MSRLETLGLSAGYGDVTILDGVDLVIPDGQVTVLIGPNGCGKSTLLKTMARILKPQRGHALLDGKSIHALNTRAVAAALGLLPQGPVAPEGLTVRELVAQGRFPHQSLLRQWTRADEDAVDKAMAIARVADFADRAVDTLSGGQRQRCWVAMVLAQDTDLILLDEPTTFLDLKVQVDLMDLFAGLAHDHGRTLVIVLHELSLAAAYADYLVMMKSGQVVAAGDPQAIFTAARLKEVFDLDASVLRDPASGRPVCVPFGARRRIAEAAQ